MKKINTIISLLVVLLMASEVLANIGNSVVGMGAEMRFRYSHYVNLNGGVNDEVYVDDYFSQRSLIRADLHANDKLGGRLTLIHTSQWGDNLDSETSGFPNAATPNKLVGDNSLFISEAYGIWVPIDMLNLRVGRGTFDLHDGAVLSSNDFQDVLTTFDHILVTYHRKPLKAHLWYTELANIVDDNEEDRQSGFFGLNVDFVKPLPKFVDIAGLYLIYSIHNSMNFTNSDNEVQNIDGYSALRYGLHVSGQPQNFNYNASLSGHIGTREITPGREIDTEGFMIDLKASYVFPAHLNLKVFAGFHWDSGDDSNDNNGSERYDSFFYNFHDNAGEMDVFEWGNLTYWNIGLGLDPIEDLNVGVTYFMFRASDAADSFHARDGGSQGISNSLMYGGRNSDKLGWEIDVWATKKCQDYLDFSLTYSLFDPGKYFSANGADYDTSSRIFFQARLKF